MSTNDECLAMSSAIKTGDDGKLRNILKKGCNPDIVLKESSGLFALVLAIVHKQTIAVKTLLQFKASLNLKDKYGKTAIMYACIHKTKEIFSLLESAGADLTVLDNKGRTTLHYAAQHGSLGCLERILKNCIVDVNLVDSEEKSAVMFAASGNDIKCLELLARHRGVDINKVDKDGNSPLMAAIHRSEGSHAQILLDIGADVNVKNIKGKTALSKAFEQMRKPEMVEIVTQLLVHGAKPNCSSGDELYLHEMIARGQKEIVQLMIINGCTPWLRQCKESVFQFDITEKLSPFAVALLSNQLATAKYLLATLFLTPFDVVDLPKSQEIILHLSENHDNRCWSLLKAISASPLPLFVLTFMAVSKLIFKKDCKHKAQYQEDVLSRLPKPLQEKLLYRTRSASLCFQEWETIPLMFETGYVLRVTQPLYSIWPIGQNLIDCTFPCCAKKKGYRLSRNIQEEDM